MTNGEFDEPVMYEIDGYNRQCVEDGRDGQQIQTIVRGELLEMFLGLGADFWPPQLSNFKTLLEIYLSDGRGCIPKNKLAVVLESSIGVTRQKKVSGPECGRLVSGGAIVTSMALSSYSAANNHVAEFEAWTMYLVHLLAVAERWSVAKKYWKAEADLAVNAMFSCLARLCEELSQRSGNYVEGNSLVDKPLYRVRLTQLIGLMCVYGLWMKEADRRSEKHLEFIRSFCARNVNELLLWGEYAIPQFLAWYLFAPNVDPTARRHSVMANLIDAISEINSSRGDGGVPNPYYSPEEIWPYLLGLKSEKLGDTFTGESFTIGALVDLHVRANFKQSMKRLWPNVSKIAQRSFVPEQKWEYYLWRSERGSNLEVWPNPTQLWDTMIREAHESKGEDIPKLVKLWPVAYLSYLIVAPHRINRSGVRWLATAVN